MKAESIQPRTWATETFQSMKTRLLVQLMGRTTKLTETTTTTTVAPAAKPADTPLNIRCSVSTYYPHPDCNKVMKINQINCLNWLKICIWFRSITGACPRELKPSPVRLEPTGTPLRIIVTGRPMWTLPIAICRQMHRKMFTNHVEINVAYS